MHAIFHSEDAPTNDTSERLLSDDEYALLNKLRTQSQRNLHGVRTGRVSVDEIMGLRKFYDVQTFLENWRSQNRPAKRGWLPPLNCLPFMNNVGIGDLFPSSKITDASQKRSPMAGLPKQISSFVNREISKNSAAYSSSFCKRANSSSGSNGQKGKHTCSITSGKSTTMDMNQTSMSRNQYVYPSKYSSSELHSTNRLNATRREEISQEKKFLNNRNTGLSSRANQVENVKRMAEKKNYFSEYISADSAARGLGKGQLYKGTLHVNSRSFEESFLVNANGNLQEDLLIFGLHDRNRALHGDVVIVRVKDRENWLVRDVLFCAWREGHLRAFIDENGQPITVPPIRSFAEEEEFLESLNLPFAIDKKDLLRKAKVTHVPRLGKFNREQMLLILTQSINSNSRCFDIKSSATLRSDVMQKLVDLCILKSQKASFTTIDSVTSSPNSVNSSSNSQQSQNNLLLHRRYYFLRDLPDEYWGMPNICLQRTAEVVFISEHKNSRAAVGMLKMMADGNRKWALFSPNDSRMPRMMIPAGEAPADFFDKPHDFSKYIYVARMIQWPATAQFARGKLYKSLGTAGDIFAETEGLLLANAVDTRSFPTSVLRSLPILENEEWKIDEKEFKYRRDFRNEFVFGIRAAKNRPLENAFHVKPICDFEGNGKRGWEVGVHVTDVAYFVNAGTELDQWAAFRANSIHMVNETIQMLPQILVDDICSLNIGSDRLCMSVVWKVDENAAIYNEWFGRSIVCLRTEIPLDCAQVLVGKTDNDSFDEKRDLMNVESNDSPLKKSLFFLNKMATLFRKRRFEKGSMQLEKTHLSFHIDETSGLPSELAVHYDNESGWFVEEILMLANIAVAREIEKVYGETALLRRQNPPKPKMLNETLEKIRRIGINLSACTGKAIASYLDNYDGSAEYKKILLRVISHFLLRSMQLPEYFCVGMVKDRKEFGHFSLAVPFYTHFTNPLSRYADIMVQRFLSAAVGQTPPPRFSVKDIAKIAAHCNDRELTAKAVSETSDDMFFGLHVKKHGPLTERAVVVQILDTAFDVFIVRYGIIKRVQANKLRTVRKPRFIDGISPTLTLYWDSHENTNASVEQLIQLCSVVDVIVSPVTDSIRCQVSMKQPTAGGRAPSLLDGIQLL